MIAVELRGVQKTFATPWIGESGFKQLLLHPRKTLRRRKRGGFTALSDVSFAVEAGTFFGVVGRNGAGKSTVLGLIGGILRPNAGSVHVHGRISLLKAIAIGMEAQLTGRENIVLSGVLLGMRRSAAIAHMDEIIAFSGLGEHIDQPFFTYSSGMQMRLGFSVAIQAEPEILLVDEVLAVGDAAFQARCLERIAALRRQGTTAIVASHDLNMVAESCDRAIWLDRGRVAGVGPPQTVVNRYRESLEEAEGASRAAPRVEAGEGGDDEGRAVQRPGASGNLAAARPAAGLTGRGDV